MEKGRMIRFALYGLAIFLGLGIPVFATGQDYPTKQIELIFLPERIGIVEYQMGVFRQ